MARTGGHGQDDLRDFVLGYCRQVGAIVEPPAYGIYDVLLPDEVAASLGTVPFLRLAFEEVTGWEPPHDVTLVHHGHALLEGIVQEVRRQTANARAYINRVRLDRRGLFDLVVRALSFPNARLSPQPGTVEGQSLYHYLRFNFKAALLSDEKQEQILPVWLYLQGGYAVDGALIERPALLEGRPAFPGLPPAPLSWRPGETILSPDILPELLERARQAALEGLSGSLDTLERRAQRFLELDEARLEAYYDDLRRDLERRLQRAGEERRESLESKLAAVETERQAKLADAREKHRLRVTLELVNLLLVVQPKVRLPIQVQNRTATIVRTAVWDPLRQQVEPLLCDVCGRPAQRLWLCSGGHLAHAECLLPQCVACKRVYCRLCGEEMDTCVVCDRPICRHSLQRCPTCGRSTCQEHGGLCHADDGAPQRLVPDRPAPVQPVEDDQSAQESPPAPAPPAPADETPRPGKAPRPARSTVKGRSPRAAPKKPPPKKATARQIEVYVETEAPVVTAYVMAGGRTLAQRSWQLVSEGIGVLCQCEKGYACQSNGLLLYPNPVDEIEEQMEQQIRRLREEYQVPATRVKIYRVVHGRPQFERRLLLMGDWKDSQVLEGARRAYHDL